MLESLGGGGVQAGEIKPGGGGSRSPKRHVRRNFQTAKQNKTSGGGSKSPKRNVRRNFQVDKSKKKIGGGGYPLTPLDPPLASLRCMLTDAVHDGDRTVVYQNGLL